MMKVCMRNMVFYGFHGIYEYEREQGLKFFIDVEVRLADARVAETDRLEDGTDPAAIYRLVREIMENTRFQMQERLAAYIGDRLLEKYGHFASVLTMVRKQAVPIPGPIDYVEVQVERMRLPEHTEDGH